jgi:hypothetical protein
MLLTGLPTAAIAEGAGRCYPPPCGQPENGMLSGPGPAGPALAVAEDAAPADDRSPVPFVTIGLLAVSASFAVVVLRRRSNILRRSKVASPRPRWTGPDSRLRPAQTPTSAPDLGRDGRVRPDGVTI